MHVNGCLRRCGAGSGMRVSSAAAFRDAYETTGSNAGMAAFIAMTSWRGDFTDDYFAQPAPDPARFGMPSKDDGSRDDPLLSDRSGQPEAFARKLSDVLDDDN
jgi:hypothetical protein